MPDSPMTLCPEPGCKTRVKKGRCEQHKPQRLNPELDKEYKSRRWRDASLQFRKKNALCVLCMNEGRVVKSHCVDHINPVVEGGSFWDKSNWQAICKSHHSTKTRNELNARKL